jgi:hypothetical protein
MMQMKLKLVGILSLAATLSACSYFEQIISPSPYSRQQMCSQLKHELIFDDKPPTSTTNNYTPTEKAQLANRYQDYHCTDFEPPPASPPEELTY